MPQAHVDPARHRELLQALADPSRLRILHALQSDAPRVTDVVRATGLSQPNVSKHLRCLLGCGLVEREQRGREAHYRVADGVEALFALLDRMDRCELTERAA